LEEGQEPVAAGQHVGNVGIYLRYGREPMSASPAQRDVGICDPKVHTYIHTHTTEPRSPGRWIFHV
jgi:hypothetical protein